MSGPGWSVRDLAKLAGTTVRTIHYYVSEGILPPPAGATRSAVYTPAHLARLRLIAALRDEGLSLAAIRQRLAPLTDRQVQEIADAVDAHLRQPGETPWTTLGLIEAALATNQSADDAAVALPLVQPERPAEGNEADGLQMPLEERREQFDATGGRRGSAAEYLSRILDRPGQKPVKPVPIPRPKPPLRRPDSDRPEGWYHYRIADGIELRVREDRYRESGGRMRAVVDTLRATLRRYGVGTSDSEAE